MTEKDNGRTVCARVSQRVEVYLSGTVASPWSPITAAGTQLQPTASGKLSLKLGTTGAVFTAVAPGETVVVSTRPMCGASGSDCPTTVSFRVTVSVQG